jgi:AFG3 family protein
MDLAVQELSEKAYARTIELIEKHKKEVGLVAQLLLEKETISHTDVAQLIGER